MLHLNCATLYAESQSVNCHHPSALEAVDLARRLKSQKMIKLYCRGRK